MQSMSKKRRNCESNDGIEDRLSGLPDEVIVHILTLMPTLDAVRTMLLRRFADLWTLVPALRFDFREYYGRMVVKPPSTVVAFSSFSCFVRNVLLLYRRSTMDTFHLCTGDLLEMLKDFHLRPGNLLEMLKDAKIISDVRMWLRYAIDREVKDLFFRYFSPFFNPPRCFFTSQSLATLELIGCTIEHQSQFHMGKLRKLSLICVKGSAKSYNQLISGCSSLQELNISFTAFSGFEILNINAPIVSKLRIRVLNNRCSCTLNCPSLKILDIDVSEESPYFQLSVIGVISLKEVNVQCLPTRYYSGEVQPFFKLFQDAEVFTLSCKAFKELSSTEKIEFSLNRWRQIVLHLEWNGERCLEVIFKMMKNSVNLEELILHAGETSGDCELLCPELTASVLPLLKTVTIHGNHGYRKWCEGQLQVVEFLLTKSIVLEKMVITFGENKLTTDEKFDLVKQVSTFRRASTNATVIFA